MTSPSDKRLARWRERIIQNNDLKTMTDDQLSESYLGNLQHEAEWNELKGPFLEMIREMRREANSRSQVSNQQEESKTSKESKNNLGQIPIYDHSKDKPKKPSMESDPKLEVDIFYVNDGNKIEEFMTIPAWEKSFLNFLVHCKSYVAESRLSLKLVDNKLSLAVLDVKKMGSNQSQEHTVELCSLPLYEIFPSFMWVIFRYGDNCNAEKELNSWLESVDPKNIVISQPIEVGAGCFQNPQTKISDDLAFSRLLKIIHFFNKTPFAHFKPDCIDKFRENIKSECAGFDYYADKIHEEFISTLTSSIFELPKGILFYGPPRTGKTHSSKKVIELLNFWRIHADLAAGDFSKPLVGQSEQMVNKIVDRCDVIPWELCCLFIDEIDGLCPNRKGAGASSGKVDLISVFLSVMDGNKRKKNLMIIGTSNRLKYMDDAFLQRLDIKLFIGLPNVKSREDWIKRMVDRAFEAEKSRLLMSNKVQNEKMKYITKVSEFIKGNAKNDILRYTINFTADAMKKSLAQILTNAIQKAGTSNEKDPQEELKQLVYKSLNRICESDKIFISISTPPDLVKELDYLENVNKYNKINWNILKKKPQTGNNMMILENGPIYTQRMLIDLKESSEERFELEIGKIDRIGKDQVDTVKKIKNYLTREATTKKPNALELLENFRDTFAEHYFSMDPDCEELLKKEPERAKELLFEPFVNNIWPKILNEDKNSSIETFGICHEEILVSKYDALKILMKMAVEAKINIVIVFDIAYFTKAGITNDDGIAQEILIATEEAMQYDSCLVVFDLDSIADITKEYNSLQSEIQTASQIAYSNDKNDPQFAYCISRKQAFRAALECLAIMPSKDKNHWFVAISNNNKLTLDFKEKVNWPATNQQKKVEKEIILNNVSKRCQCCFETFREKDNDANACGSHSSPYLYDEEMINGLKAVKKDDPKYDPFKDKAAERWIYFTKEYVFSELSKLSNKDKRSPALHRLGRFKWVCCEKSFWEKGEIKAKHVAFTK